MKPIDCPREAEILLCARTGRWTDSARAHRAACPTCGETALAAELLAGLAGEPAGRLPDPQRIWLDARAVHGRAGRDRALRALDWAESAALTAAALALAVCAFRFWPVLCGWSERLPAPEPWRVPLACLALCVAAAAGVKLFQTD